MQLLNSQTLHLTPRLIVHPSPKLILRYRFQAFSVHRGDSYQILTQRTQDFIDLVTKEKRVLRSIKLVLDGNSQEDAHSQSLEKNQLRGIDVKRCMIWASAFSLAFPVQYAQADVAGAVYDVAAIFELSIQLSYLLMLLALIGVGTFFVIRQVLTRRELDLSAKELQEQVRSGDASATEYFELGAVMLRRKIYPAATKYFLQAIEKWDGDDQDLSQVYNALGVSYVRDEKLDKAVLQFEAAVKLQPGYVTAWNNLGDTYDKKKEYVSALKAFEEALLFDPNNTVARPRRDALRERVDMYKGVPVRPSKK